MKDTKKRVIEILVIIVMLATSVIQIIGFSTPAWACNFHQNLTHNATDCELIGLFYSNGLLSEDIFFLSVFSMVGSLVFTIILIVFIFRKRSTEEGYRSKVLDDVRARIVFVLFNFFQLFAAVVLILCLVRFDKIGWSAITFCTLGTLVTVLVAIAIGISFIKNFRLIVDEMCFNHRAYL